MQTIIVISAIVAVALSAPVDDSRNARIIRYENDNIGIDGYKFGFETSDGTSRDEEAELRNAGTDNEALVVRGSYSYLGPDGVQYTVTYIADENGFHPQGAHLPQVPQSQAPVAAAPAATKRPSLLRISSGALASLVG